MAMETSTQQAPPEQLHVAPPGSWDVAPTAERRRIWGRHALFAAASIGAFGGFLAVSRTARRPGANRFDTAVMHALARVRNPWLNEMVRDLTSLGGATVVMLTAVTAVGVSRRRAPLTALQIALGSLGGVVAELALKSHFGRLRPAIVAPLQRVTSSSFPSGHTLASSCLCLTLGFVGSRRTDRRHTRTAMITAGAAMASVVGLTRIYLGVHYPTDVIGGLAIGTAWACLLEAGFDFIGAREFEQRRREARAARRAAAGRGR